MNEQNWLKFTPRAAADQPATIQIFDQIGEDWFGGSGLSAKAFSDVLSSVGNGPLVVEINSPGGNVWDGLSIYNMLRARSSTVTTRVVGVAASIASIIALAGDSVEMSDASLMMIHDPSGVASGTSEDMRKMADALDQHAEVLAGVYSKKTGINASKIRDAMRSETWFTAAEALDFGLIDSISESDQVAMTASAGREWFAKIQAKMTHPKISAESTDAEAEKQTQQIGATQSAVPTPQMENTEQVVAAAPVAPSAAFDVEGIIAKAVEAALAKRSVPAAPAPEPIAASVQNLGNPLIEKHRGFKAGAERKAWLIENHAELLKQNSIFAPQNANTFASTLVVDYLADALIVVATDKLAALGAFTRQVGLDGMRPGAVVRVKKFTSGTAAQTNPTNWETNNDSTLAATTVTVEQISKNFTVTQAELNQGFALSDLAAGSADIFANGISDKVTAVMTSGNFGAGTVIGVASAFDTSDLPAILALAKNYRSKVLLLDGGHLARLQFSSATSTFPDARFGALNNGRFGFDVVAEQNRWTGAATNAAGFVCGPDAIAIASGSPVGMVAGEFIEQRAVTTTNGLTSLISVWYSRATRSHMASYDIMFGAAAGDTTQAEVLVTA